MSEGASPAQIINSCIISSPLWALFRVDKLAKNMRLLRDPHLSEADRARRLQHHEDVLAIGDDVATKTENGEVSVPATTVSLLMYVRLRLRGPHGGQPPGRLLGPPMHFDASKRGRDCDQ